MKTNNESDRRASVIRRFPVKAAVVTVVLITAMVLVWTSCVRSVARIAPPPTDLAPDAPNAYMGLHDVELAIGLPPAHLLVRHIARIDARLCKGTDLDTSLYLVESGTVTEISRITFGASSAELGFAPLGRFHATLALCDAETPIGRVTLLGCRVYAAGAATISSVKPHRAGNVTTRLFPGTVISRKGRIIYVEGTDSVDVTGNMSVEDFATRNNGDYLVITLRLR